MLELILLAMYSSTSSGVDIRSRVAFLRRIAMRVSRSGGWTSQMRPHSNRDRSRSSNPDSCFGGRSEVMTTCFVALCSALKVWKNSSCVCTLPARNWMSSMRSTSTSR